MSMYIGVKLLEHAMAIVEKVLQKRLREIVTIDDMQYVFVPGKGAIDAVFITRSIQEEYIDKQKKLYVCIVDMLTAFDRFPRKVVEWVMRKKGIPEASVGAVISLYKGAKTTKKVGTHLCDELGVNVGVHRDQLCQPCCSPL